MEVESEYKKILNARWILWLSIEKVSLMIQED